MGLCALLVPGATDPCGRWAIDREERVRYASLARPGCLPRYWFWQARVHHWSRIGREGVPGTNWRQLCRRVGKVDRESEWADVRRAGMRHCRRGRCDRA